MKILCAEYNDAGEVAVVPVGDDVLLRNNGDFYIPDYTQQVSGVPQLVVRICKLGKSVGNGLPAVILKRSESESGFMPIRWRNS